jgi:hypothetical protein
VAAQGDPCIWNGTTLAYDAADGLTAVVGVYATDVSGASPARIEVRQNGRVTTDRADLVPGTVYYAAVGGDYTAAAGTDDQRVGPAVSNTDIEVQLEFLRGIAWGFDAAASEVSVADAGGYYSGSDVEAVLQELGAAPTTLLIVGSAGCGHTTLAAALTAAAALTPSASNVIHIHITGYYTDATAHSLPDYVNIRGSGQVLSGAVTCASVSNAAKYRGVVFSSATGRTNLLANTKVDCDQIIEDVVTFGVDGGPGAPAAGTVVYADLPWPCYVIGSYLNVTPSGSMVIDVWHHDDARPTDSDSITASGTPPTVSAGTRAADTTLTSWTRSLAVGQIAANVDSATTSTRGTLQLKVRRWAVS